MPIIDPIAQQHAIVVDPDRTGDVGELIVLEIDRIERPIYRGIGCGSVALALEHDLAGDVVELDAALQFVLETKLSVRSQRDRSGLAR